VIDGAEEYRVEPGSGRKPVVMFYFSLNTKTNKTLLNKQNLTPNSYFSQNKRHKTFYASTSTALPKHRP